MVRMINQISFVTNLQNLSSIHNIYVRFSESSGLESPIYKICLQYTTKTPCCIKHCNVTNLQNLSSIHNGIVGGFDGETVTNLQNLSSIHNRTSCGVFYEIVTNLQNLSSIHN